MESDRVLIVNQAYIQDIDPALVELNHELKPQNGAGGVVSTAPILDLDLNTPAGVGSDFLTTPHPSSLDSGVMVSSTYQVAVIDGFIHWADTTTENYSANPGADGLLYAKSTSSLILDATSSYVFATDLEGSKSNNIYYCFVQSGMVRPRFSHRCFD